MDDVMDDEAHEDEGGEPLNLYACRNCQAALSPEYVWCTERIGRFPFEGVVITYHCPCMEPWMYGCQRYDFLDPHALAYLQGKTYRTGEVVEVQWENPVKLWSISNHCEEMVEFREHLTLVNDVEAFLRACGDK